MKSCSVCKATYDDSVSFCANDGEVLEEDPSSLVGSTLDGQYHIEALVGRGGMGAVYKARHILLGDQVAIKVLPPQMRGNPEWLRRFRREGQASRRFRHSSAVTVYDLRTTGDGLIYMVMEFVEGHTLDAELKRRVRLTPAEALSMLTPIMQVLGAAHAVGVVHRDLKPENIMISASGGAKLLDLGIAKIREIAASETTANTALTTAGQILGTPYYMSPEQWGELPRDGSTEIDGRADIYSLGTVFFEAVSGRRPFTARTLPEARRSHVSEPVPLLHHLFQDVPESFGLTIARSMSKDRADRQSTMAEFENELRSALGLSRVEESVKVVPTDRRASEPMAPYQGDDAATVSINESRTVDKATNSNQVAPTLVTLDAPFEEETVSRTPPQMAATQASLNVPAAAKAGESNVADVEPRNMGTMGEPIARATQAIHPVPASRTGLKIAAVLIVLIGLVAAGAVWAWVQMSRRTGREASLPATVPVGPSDVSSNPVPRRELLGYYVEQVNDKGAPISARITGDVTLKSGDQFRLVVLPRESGYLYIVASDAKGTLSGFLTSLSRPAGANRVTADKEFSFPQNGAIGLDNQTGKETYTVIFSPEPLDRLDFLKVRPGTKLSPAQESEFRSFTEKSSANMPEVSVNKDDAGKPVTVVTVSPNEVSDPVVFQIVLNHI